MAKYDCVDILLKEHFRAIVAKVASFLLKEKGPNHLRNIIQQTKFPRSRVLQSLCVLIQHHMVRFTVRERGFIEYWVDTDEVLNILRYNNYLNRVKLLFGEIGEIIVKRLLYHGQQTTQHVIRNVADILKDKERKECHNQAKDTFLNMVKQKFLCRVLQTEKNEPRILPDTFEFQEQLYRLPYIDIKEIDVDSAELKDVVYWKVNNSKFEQCMRNEIIVSAIERSVDTTGAEVIKCILKLAESNDAWITHTSGISKQEIARDISKEAKQYLGQYLAVLADESPKVITKVADQQGGMYQVNWKECWNELTWATVESVVRERYGSDCLRIFRVIRLNKYVEQKQISEMAMIPAKEAKGLTYRLFLEQIVSVKEFSRTADHAPSRTIYVYYIDLYQVVTNMLMWCYKSITNLVMKRTTETSENKKILEKEVLVKNLLASLNQPDADDEQVKAAEEIISSSEKEQLTKIKKFFRLAELGETAVCETTFIFELYMRYFKINS